MTDKNIHVLVKKTPEGELKKFGIPNTPSLRRKIHDKALYPEQKVLCYLKALFNYDPFEDNLSPCPEAGLHFQVNLLGNILRLLHSIDDTHLSVDFAFGMEG